VVPVSQHTTEPEHVALPSRHHDQQEPPLAPVDDIWRVQQHGSTFDKLEAISALGSSVDPMAELMLVNFLYDQDPVIRESAVESLAFLATRGAIEALGFALTDPSPLVRRAAMEFLADNGTPNALAALAAMLVDPDVELRLAAVYELADNDTEAGSTLLQGFLSDTDPAVRTLAAEFLTD